MREVSGYLEKYVTYATPLLYGASVCAVLGFVASLFYNWYLSTLFWNLAFLCKWAECWLLKHAILEEADMSGVSE